MVFYKTIPATTFYINSLNPCVTISLDDLYEHDERYGRLIGMEIQEDHTDFMKDKDLEIQAMKLCFDTRQKSSIYLENIDQKRKNILSRDGVSYTISFEKCKYSQIHLVIDFNKEDLEKREKCEWINETKFMCTGEHVTVWDSRLEIPVDMETMVKKETGKKVKEITEDVPVFVPRFKLIFEYDESGDKKMEYILFWQKNRYSLPSDKEHIEKLCQKYRVKRAKDNVIITNIDQLADFRYGEYVDLWIENVMIFEGIVGEKYCF